METDEVIAEKVIENVLYANSNEKVSNNKGNNDKSIIIENTSKTQNENKKNTDFEVNQINNCDKSVIENNTPNKQNCNTTNSVNDQQKSFTDTSINYNETSINDDNNKQATIDMVVEDSKQTDDVCIVHEKSNGNKLSSLTAIALEYGNSDSETEGSLNLNKQNNDQSTVLKEVQMQSYRVNKESSSEESDSEEDSSSDSDSSVLIESDDSDSDNTNKPSKGKKKTKEQRSNELKSELDDLPPIEDLKISVPEILCDSLGEIAWMVEQLVVVQPKPGKPTLNLDTILFVDRGKRALGKIFDVFGQVKEPHYCVRFNSSEHIQECDIKVGMTVYYCPNTEYTSLVFLHELMKLKGIDANADEPPEFSDDEEERAYYEKLKQAKQCSKITEGDIPFKRKRASSPNSGWQSNHPWNINKQKNRKGYYSRDQRQFHSIQAGSQLQNPWVHPYQNNWSNIPGGLHSTGTESYGYGIYPPGLQSMQYVNSTVNNMNQNFYNLPDYYNENGTTAPSNPRIPYNMGPRINPEHLLYQNRPNSPSSLRFRNDNVTWNAQVSTRMNTPWISLPPPPPPPPPPPTSSSPSLPETS